MRRFVVVEDAPNLLRWLLDSIRREVPGAEAFGATNGADALSLVAERSPELVILDLALPVGPEGGPADPNVGLSVLEAVMPMSPRPRVVVMSSFDLQEDCLTRGADAFVSKNSRDLWPELLGELIAAASPQEDTTRAS